MSWFHILQHLNGDARAELMCISWPNDDDDADDSNGMNIERISFHLPSRVLCSVLMVPSPSIRPSNTRPTIGQQIPLANLDSVWLCAKNHRCNCIGTFLLFSFLHTFSGSLPETWPNTNILLSYTTVSKYDCWWWCFCRWQWKPW